MASNLQSADQDHGAQTPASNSTFPALRFATIIVGESQKRFFAPEHLLVRESKFFDKALTGQFLEGQTKTVWLKEEDPLTVEFFVYWLRNGSFPEKLFHEDDSYHLHWHYTGPLVRPHPDRFIDFYIFADRYDIKRLRNYSVKGLFDCTYDERLPQRTKIIKAFEFLRPHTPLCRLIVDLYCYWAKVEDEAAKFEPAAFVQATCRRMIELRNSHWDKGHQWCINIDDYMED